MVLEEFYSLLADDKDIRRMHIPRSEIFYIKAAVKAKYAYEADETEIEIAVLELWESGELEVPPGLLKELKRIYR